MKKNVYIIIVIVLLVVILLGGTVFFIKYYKDKSHEADIKSENIIVEKDNYKLKISYPTFGDNKFNNKIEKFVNEKKKYFLNVVKDLDESENSYELNINYDCTNYENIYSIHFKIFYYLENGYEREDCMFYYDLSNNKEIFLENLFDENIYNVLETSSKSFLKNSFQNYDTETLQSDFDLIIFTNDSLYLLLPSYQVSYLTLDEFMIPIDYNDVKDFLNKEYFKDVSFESNENNETETIPEPEVKEEIIVKRDADFFKDKKLVAFTFDDGPTWSTTNNFLDELDKRNAKVSFFVLGQRANTQKQLIKKIYDNGHTLGSHTYNHKNLLKLTDEEIAYEINNTNAVLESITGVKPKYLRPPYGNYNSKILSDTEMTFILWNVDTQDWKLKDADKIYDRILEKVTDGSIILLHDLYDFSINGVLKAMDELEKQGYAFVSIDEMAILKGKTLELHKAYRYIK